jgi:hypothetical protein
MKSIKIKDHEDAYINNGWRKLESNDKDFLFEHKHCKIWQTPSHTSKVVATNNFKNINFIVLLNWKWFIAKASCLA